MKLLLLKNWWPSLLLISRFYHQPPPHSPNRFLKKSLPLLLLPQILTSAKSIFSERISLNLPGQWCFSFLYPNNTVLYLAFLIRYTYISIHPSTFHGMLFFSTSIQRFLPTGSCLKFLPSKILFAICIAQMSGNILIVT